MALEPHETVEAVRRQAHRPAPADPPRLLQHPPGVGPAFEPIREAEPLAAAHRHWRDASLGTDHPTAHPPSTGTGVQRLADEAKHLVKRRLSAAVGDELARIEQIDRALIGDLVQVVDLIAARLDELGRRLLSLESLVEEVVMVTSEELTALRASITPPPTDVPPDVPTHADDG